MDVRLAARLAGIDVTRCGASTPATGATACRPACRIACCCRPDRVAGSGAPRSDSGRAAGTTGASSAPRGRAASAHWRPKSAFLSRCSPPQMRSASRRTVLPSTRLLLPGRDPVSTTLPRGTTGARTRARRQIAATACRASRTVTMIPVTQLKRMNPLEKAPAASGRPPAGRSRRHGLSRALGYTRALRSRLRGGSWAFCTASAR